MKGCCFTGYRPEKMPFPYDESAEEYRKFEADLSRAIDRAMGDGFDTFYSGGAMGFDLLAAELVLALRGDREIRLILVKPYAAQGASFKDGWNERYKRVAAAADETVCPSLEYSRDCYMKRNKYMVDNSERVITFFDGQSGGTANTVRYAKRMGREIVNIAEQNENYSLFD